MKTKKYILMVMSVLGISSIANAGITVTVKPLNSGVSYGSSTWCKATFQRNPDKGGSQQESASYDWTSPAVGAKLNPSESTCKVTRTSSASGSTIRVKCTVTVNSDGATNYNIMDAMIPEFDPNYKG